jgi:hypothetical protein
MTLPVVVAPIFFIALMQNHSTKPAIVEAFWGRLNHCPAISRIMWNPRSII